MLSKTDEFDTMEGYNDQALRIFAEIDGVEDIVTEALSRTDPNYLIEGIIRYKALLQSSGVALAKMLYYAQKVWTSSGGTADFYEVISERVGISRATAQRYQKVWEMHDKSLIPQEFAEDVKKLPMRLQVPIAQLISQDYKPNPEQWEKLIDCPNPQAQGQIIRSIKQAPPKRGSVYLTMDRDGNVFVHTWNNKYQIAKIFLEKITQLREGPQVDAIYLGIQRLVGGSNILEDE